jgi:quercetin dioxygenase-like cupin family protein
MSGVDFHYADGVFVKAITIERTGSLVPQHAHQYDHTSFVAAGEVMAWRDGEYVGRITAPSGLLIVKGAKHSFLTCQPNTVILCIHNLHGSGAVALLAEHEFTPGEVAQLLSEVVV